MEKRFTQPGPVLDEQGRPVPGWGSAGLLEYDRRKIRAPFYRIKEWDWYQVSDDEKALQFTYGHASYAGQVGVMLFDFAKGTPIFNRDVLLPLPFGSLQLGRSADEDGVLEYNKKGVWMRLAKKADQWSLDYRCEGFEAQAVLTRQNPHALVINIPFDESPTAFYYNHKINCLTAKARVVCQGQEYLFDENAWGLLDWGRGVWPFHNEWFWSNASGWLNGEVFGFNLGCGFGNTSQATENAVFYQGEIHKLGRVMIEPGKPYTEPWKLYDQENRISLALHPVYDRTTQTKMLWVDNSCHQMFGTFSGYVKLDNGTRLDVNGITGFAEHAINNW